MEAGTSSGSLEQSSRQDMMLACTEVVAMQVNMNS